MRKLIPFFRSKKKETTSEVQQPISPSQKSRESPMEKGESSQLVSADTVAASSNLSLQESFDSEMQRITAIHVAQINNLPPNLPDGILQLAAINEAFLQSILVLRKMNLDDDLFLSAVQDLRKQYETARKSYIKRQREKPSETSDKHLMG